MKHFKYLLFLSTLCSLVFFTNCNCDCTDSINNAFKLLCVLEDCKGYEDPNEGCHCGEVIEFIPDSLTVGMHCTNKRGIGRLSRLSSTYFRVKNYCSDSIINVCSYGWERDRNSGDLVDTRLGLVDSTKWCNRDFEPW